MSIRIKLLLLIVFLSSALLVNLVALGFLARTVAIAFETIEEVGTRQHLIAVQMQARLRDSEAALYRYLMEGEAGFKTQFDNQLRNFETDVAIYQAQVSNPTEKNWAESLIFTRQQAASIGSELIRLRDEQGSSLSELETTQAKLNTLLTNQVRTSRLTDVTYQETVNGMQDNLRELYLAITAYLASPEEIEPVRFTEAVIGFRHYQDEFRTLAKTPQERAWVAEINALFAEVESRGSFLISGRNQQQSQFANFAAILFRAGEEVLVGQIQPQAAQNLVTARQQLQTALNFAVTTSLIVAFSASLIAGIVTWPLLRQMSRGMLALLRGAGRVAKGDLSKPVQLKGQDELSELAKAFNSMMADLATRERHLKARLSELEALRQVSLQLTSTLDPDKVLDAIAPSTLNLVSATEVHIFVCGDDGQNLEFAASARQDETNKKGPRQPRADGITAMVARTGQPQVINQADAHPLFSTPEASQWGIKATASFPLKRGEQVLGVFNVSLNDRYSFGKDDLRILGLLSDQAAIALENARLYKGLAEREARLRTLAQKLAQIQEEERRLIGLDLHDGLTQLLLSANMHLDTLASLSHGLAGKAKSELGRGRARLREAITEARWVVSELRPAVLEDFGLVSGLRHYATEISELENWQLEFVADLSDVKLNPAVETAIFRIAQEALTNARKYTNPDRIRVALQTDETNLTLEVQDWGRGFNIQALSEESQRLGLVGMQERTVLLGGEFQIESQPGKGTRISAHLPLFAVEKS
jgi:signal transduction histidine kinase